MCENVSFCENALVAVHIHSDTHTHSDSVHSGFTSTEIEHNGYANHSFFQYKLFVIVSRLQARQVLQVGRQVQQGAQPRLALVVLLLVLVLCRRQRPVAA